MTSKSTKETVVLAASACAAFFVLIGCIALCLVIVARLTGISFSGLAVTGWSNPLFYGSAALLFVVFATMFGIAAGSPIPALEALALTLVFGLLPRLTAEMSVSAQSVWALAVLTWLVVFLLSMFSRILIGAEIRWGLPSFVEVPMALSRRLDAKRQSTCSANSSLKASDAHPS